MELSMLKKSAQEGHGGESIIPYKTEIFAVCSVNCRSYTMLNP